MVRGNWKLWHCFQLTLFMLVGTHNCLAFSLLVGSNFLATSWRKSCDCAIVVSICWSPKFKTGQMHPATVIQLRYISLSSVSILVGGGSNTVNCGSLKFFLKVPQQQLNRYEMPLFMSKFLGLQNIFIHFLHGWTSQLLSIFSWYYSTCELWKSIKCLFYLLSPLQKQVLTCCRFLWQFCLVWNKTLDKCKSQQAQYTTSLHTLNGKWQHGLLFLHLAELCLTTVVKLQTLQKPTAYTMYITNKTLYPESIHIFKIYFTNIYFNIPFPSMSWSPSTQ